MQTFSQFLKIIENFVSEQRFWGKNTSLYEPIEYMFSLPAKRVRPALMLLGYQLFSKDYQKALPIAFAYEAFHNFTLIHDDIMDQAPLRRGFPTIHIKYNTNAGILSGDALLINVYEYIRKHTPSEKLDKVLECFNKMAIEVCEGQQMDMEFEKAQVVSLTDYLEMIQFKTAVLLGASLSTGAILADASDADTEFCYELGTNLGMAFQMQDDYLDVWGDQNQTGKQKAGDIINGKKSAPYILALQVLPEYEKQTLINLYNTDKPQQEEKIKIVLGLFEQAGAQQAIRDLKNVYHSKTVQLLEHISAPDENKKHLHDLIELLLDRNV